MRQSRLKISDQSGDKKYFTMIPNYIVNHSTHYEQSLYLCMKRIAGEEGSCWASPDTIGKMMGTSSNTVRKYLPKLVERGWIRIIGRAGKTKPTNEYEVVDLWDLNMKFYAQKESSTGGTKEEPYKKNQEEDTSAQSAEIVSVIELFKEVNPSYGRLFAMPPQRAAAARLVKVHGIEKLKDMIAYLPKSNAVKYAPTITTPAQFEARLGELIAWSQKQKTPIKSANVAFV